MAVNLLVRAGSLLFRGGKTLLKATPELAFGTSAEKVGKVLRDSYTSGASARTLLKNGMSAVNRAGNSNFFGRMFKNFKTLIPDLGRYTKAGVRLARMKGANPALGALKGLVKGVGKKMPFIFAATIALTEIPNIVKAVKEKGIWQGVKETGKTVGKLAGAGIGAAIGSAICPGIGTLIGWVAGDWLAGKVFGKSYTEKQAEKEENAVEYLQEQGLINEQGVPAQSVPAQSVPAYNPYMFNPYNYNQMPPFTGNPINDIYYDPYADDLMVQNMRLNTLA